MRICRKDNLKDSFFEFVFVFLFIIIFRPYLMNELSISSLFEVAFKSAFIFGFLNWIYTIIEKDIDLNNWTYKKDIVRFCKRLLFTGVIFLIYTYYAINYIYYNEINFPINNYYLVSTSYILVIGMLFYFIEKFFAFVRAQLQKSSEDEFIADNQLIFFGKNKNEFVETTIQNLVYIQSMGHYLKFYLKCEINNKVEVQIIRNSTNSIKEETGKLKDLFKCHRSYVINVNEIKSIEGNSQKALLVLKRVKDKIPISRDSYKILKECYAVNEK